MRICCRELTSWASVGLTSLPSRAIINRVICRTKLGGGQIRRLSAVHGPVYNEMALRAAERFRVAALPRPGVVAECVVHRARHSDAALVMNNSPDPTVSWLARMRKVEVDMYYCAKYSRAYAAARFVSSDAVLALGSLHVDVTAGEAYEFQNRLLESGVRCVLADSEARHLAGPVSLLAVRRKYSRNSRDLPSYRCCNKPESRRQLALVGREYLSNWLS